jgi:hypothetical protein
VRIIQNVLVVYTDNGWINFLRFAGVLLLSVLCLSEKEREKGGECVRLHMLPLLALLRTPSSPDSCRSSPSPAYPGLII